MNQNTKQRVVEMDMMLMAKKDEGVLMNKTVTMLIERENDGYVALCPDLDIASQGQTIPEARANLKEALELFFETASESEIASRTHSEVYVSQLEVCFA